MSTGKIIDSDIAPRGGGGGGGGLAMKTSYACAPRLLLELGRILPWYVMVKVDKIRNCCLCRGSKYEIFALFKGKMQETQ